MTLRHLQIFLVVCEKENVTKAANELFITQPTVSQVIRELEEHYGVLLFERKGRGLSITREGEILRSYATHIVNSFEEAEKKLRKETKQEALRVGANVTVGVTMIQSLVKQFNQIYPKVRVEIFVNNSRAILEKIDRDELDLALLEEFSGMDAYLTEAFYEDRSILVAPNNHPYLKRKNISARDLADTDVLLREKGSGVRNLFDAVIYSKGIVINPIWESYTSDALIEAVKAEIGIAVLPERIARPHIESGEMSELFIHDLNLSRRLLILRHRSKILSEEGEAFVSLVREQQWEDKPGLYIGL